MCQGCVNEGYLTQETFDKIWRFSLEWPEAQSGPAHIVIGDDNVSDENIQYCLGRLDWRTPSDSDEIHSPDELIATREFLESLLAIPEAER